MLKKILVLLTGGLVCAALLLGAWVVRPLPLSSPRIDLSIEPQTSVRGIAQTVADAGIDIHPTALYFFFRLSGQSRALRAGSYEISEGQTLLDLLRKLSRGEENLRAVSLIDGWTFRQFRQALNKAEGLRHDTQDLSDDDINAIMSRWLRMSQNRAMRQNIMA